MMDETKAQFSPDRAYMLMMLAALAMLGLALVGMILTILPSPALHSLGVLVVTLATGAIGGAAVGFLFGIPRVMSGDVGAIASAPPPRPTDGSDDQTNGAAGSLQNQQGGRRLLASNSNLEQASDWLTKIILGVGLTQFYEINDALLRFETLVRRYVGPRDHLTPMIAAIVLVFSIICGFLAMYLETRLVLSRIFNSVEHDLGHDLQQAIKDRDSARRQRHIAETRADGLENAVKNIADAPETSAMTLAPAADSLLAAANSAQASPELKSLAAQALAASGRPDEASILMPQGDAASTKDRISAMQVALYKPEPAGFNEVIAIAGELSNVPEAKGSAEYWFYQAAAFGQQHHSLLASPTSDKQALHSARDNALDCIRRCLQIDNNYKNRIFWLMKPSVSPTPSDDDLADFENDSEFCALVHPSAAATE